MYVIYLRMLLDKASHMTKPKASWARIYNPHGRLDNFKQIYSLAQMIRRNFYKKVICDQQDVEEVKEGAMILPRGRSLHNRHILTTFFSLF